MAEAIVRLDQTVSEVIAIHDGVRPVEQGEGDSFVIAFGCASDAVACALDLQRAPLAPIRLRIGIHTGEVRLRDEGNYIGPTINRTARLRDLGHGGQTLLPGAAVALVEDQLPGGATLLDLGTRVLRDLPRPERVVQLCHADIRTDFPPLRAASALVHGLPAQLTTFIGRIAETQNVREALGGSRLVTLTGAGGSGKTRLAVHVASAVVANYSDGIWYVDLAPITNPDVVPTTVARALGLTDQPGYSTTDTLLRFVRDRRLLVVLDNCEHLLDASADVIVALLGAAPGVTVLATSREPLGIPGEAIWQVPSLSLENEALDLFAERARLARADFVIAEDNEGVVAEICRRLDGMPLAIEFAAARMRALSLTEIRDSLHDRFRLLTGSARTAVRRQQTLRASVDWSHALLSEPERVLFRRLAAFLGGFDLAAARAVAAEDMAERYQVLDQLSLLVDKSLVVAGGTGGTTRYRMLETVRQYALEKLGESGEADAVRGRHRDHYATLATEFDTPQRLWGSDGNREQLDPEIDNLRAAFEWCLQNSEIDVAAVMASSLLPLWLNGGRIREGQAWLCSVIDGENGSGPITSPEVYVRALTDKAMLDIWAGTPSRMDQAQHALQIARQIDDPLLLARALTACGFIASNTDDPQVAEQYFGEGVPLIQALGDKALLNQILLWRANAAIIAGDPVAALAAAVEGSDLRISVVDQANGRDWLGVFGWARLMQGDLADAAGLFRALVADGESVHDVIWKVVGLQGLGFTFAYQGDVVAARAEAEAAIAGAADFGDYVLGLGASTLAVAALAAGDVTTARQASEAAYRQLGVQQATAWTTYARTADAELAGGDLTEARRWADLGVGSTAGWHRMVALTTRGRVAMAQDQSDQAMRDLHDALVLAVEIGARIGLPDILECVAELTVDHAEAARLYGAADAIRQRVGVVRFAVHQPRYEAAVASRRDAMGAHGFAAAWAEGADLSDEEAIAYAQRGRGERKRPATGWGSLTPSEREVVKLVCEGLGNKDIATRLFVSPRTVQTHLTHVYNKLGLASRIQLIQDAARQG